MTQSQAMRAAAELFHSVDEDPILMIIDDNLPLMPHVLDNPPSSFSPVLPEALKETSSCSVMIVAQSRVDPVYPYLSIGYSPSSLVWPRLAELDVSLSDITLNFVPGDGWTVKYLTEYILGLQKSSSWTECRRAWDVKPPLTMGCQMSRICSERG